MNVLFLDDTQQIGSEYVAVGGVVFHDDQLRDLSDVFEKKKAEHLIPADEEVKWSPARHSWLREHLRGQERVAAYLDILGLVRLFRGKIIVAVTRTQETPVDVVRVKWECMRFVTERYQFLLQNADDPHGVIISDFPGSQREDRDLLRKYYELRKTGTGYVRPENIIMNVLTTESHLNPALQIADLVVGATTSMCSSRPTYAVPYWDNMKSSFYRGKQGWVMGCGLKVMPGAMVSEVQARLFPEEVPVTAVRPMMRDEDVEQLREWYSVIMTEEELDLHFPRE